MQYQKKKSTRKSNLLLRHWLIWTIVLTCFELSGSANAQLQPAENPADVVITVLDKKFHRRPIDHATLARQSKNMSAKQFARFQSESRWRPYVSDVSHFVMTDWSKQNNVSPTAKEIKELFAKEVTEHLQSYLNTKQGQMQVGGAMMWANGAAADWVTAKALHEKYGGRVAISSFGACIAIDGRNALLKEYAAAGKIEFLDPEIEKVFWEGVESPVVLDATISDPKRISKRFATPPWEGWGARKAKQLKKDSERSKSRQGKQDKPTKKEPASNKVVK